MERRSIDLKLISGKGIKSFTLFLKPSLYAAVSAVGAGRRPYRKQKKQRTPADREGGTSPEWDHPIRIVLDSPDPGLVLQFDIMAQRFLGDRLVGRVRVPLSDLSPEDPAGAFRPASYLVQASNGKPNGVLTFLYRMNGGELRIPPPDPAIYYPPPQPASAAGCYLPKLDYYPPSVSTIGCYPPPATVGHHSLRFPPFHYPPPAADAGYFPMPFPVIGYPASLEGAYGCPASPVHVARYPPQELHGYRTEEGLHR